MGLEEKLELLKLDIVYVDNTMKIILFILNVFPPGWGTMINSFMGEEWHKITFFVGLAQFLTSPILIGWIWSIWWGVEIYKKRDLGKLKSLL